jgi:uracil DNA glycosylase
MSIQEAFGDWVSIIGEPVLLKYRKMLLDCDLRGIPIEPDPSRVFHVFRGIQPKDVRAVIIGQD